MYHLLQIKLQLCCCGKITERDFLCVETPPAAKSTELPKDTWGSQLLAMAVF